MKKKILEKNRGITLIALVITVIVLLILAGISISMLTGDNSLLKRAVEAKEKTENATLKEEVELVMADRATEKIIGKENLKTLRDELEEKISGTTVEWAEGLSDVCYVKRENSEITVYEDGEIQEGKTSIWKGIKNEQVDIESPKFEKVSENVWNWYIYTAGQLKFLADFVNNGNNLTGEVRNLENYVKENTEVTMTKDTKIFLMNNIDLGARAREGTTEEAKWTNNPNTIKWTPIGTDKSNVTNILGTFEGYNHTIRGLYVNTNINYSGLFGNSNSIQNLTIKDSFIKGTKGVGSVSGSLVSGKIYNCNNKNTIIIANTYAGGIVGTARGDIENCSNSGYVSGSTTSSASYVSVGGIVGDIDNKISNCVNNGTINGNFYAIGGVVGRARENSTIFECVNNGEVNGEFMTSGVVGYNKGKKITNCVNNGSITGIRDLGGIIGKDDNSYNDSEINNCTSSGEIKGESYIGGIIGESKSDLTNCNNTGLVNGKITNIGGIAGIAYNNITGCTNKGNIKKDFYHLNSSSEYTQSVGGITGCSYGNEINDCVNNGYIDASNAAATGGIVGCSEIVLMKKCVNVGEIKANNADTNRGMQGGLVGAMNCSSSWNILDSYNSADISGYWGVGGIIGKSQNSTGNIKNCYTIGKISGIGYLGGLIGENSNSALFINSYYLDGTALNDNGNIDGANQKKDKNFITTTFIITANGEQENWIVDENKNNGYPFLK